MKKLTIKGKVIAAAETLKAMTTHTELREWAISNDMDNRSAFPKFKAALLEIGMNYDQIKTGRTEAQVVAKADSSIEKIAQHIGGNVWIKGDKRRIYVEGGNNYHYDGKWFVELYEDGSFDVKAFITTGYDNKNSSDYIAKHKARIEEQVEEAMTELVISRADLALDGVAPATEVVKEVVEFKGSTVNYGNNESEYPTSFYNGCGSYYLAFNEGRIVASVNYSHYMERNSAQERVALESDLNRNGVAFDKIIAADGSGVTFFARNESDADGLKTKVYSVPSAAGGRHKNIELILA